MIENTITRIADALSTLAANTTQALKQNEQLLALLAAQAGASSDVGAIDTTPPPVADVLPESTTKVTTTKGKGKGKGKAKAEPKAEEPKAEPKAEEPKAEPKAEAPTTEITAKDLRAAAKKLLEAEKDDTVCAILKDLGAPTVAAINPTKYAEALKRFQDAL